jgi:hypothetical protein
MRLLMLLFFAFGGSLFVSSGYYRLHHGERIPPKGWFRLCDAMLRRRRYSDDGPVAQFLPPKLSIVAGVLAIVAGISLEFGHWYS